MTTSPDMAPNTEPELSEAEKLQRIIDTLGREARRALDDADEVIKEGYFSPINDPNNDY